MLLLGACLSCGFEAIHNRGPDAADPPVYDGGARDHRAVDAEKPDAAGRDLRGRDRAAVRDAESRDRTAPSDAGCPPHSHPDGEYCACDPGYVPNPAGTACVAGDDDCDPGSSDQCTHLGTFATCDDATATCTCSLLTVGALCYAMGFELHDTLCDCDYGDTDAGL